MPSIQETPPPRVLAHRGLAVHALENSLEAMQAARACGVDTIETDAHVTADGVAVLWHDPDLRYFDGSRDRVRDLTWESLCQRRSRGSRIASLTEALEAFPDARFNIDLKTSAVIEPVAAAVSAAGAQGRVRIASFSERRRRRGQLLLPGCASSPGMAAVIVLRGAVALPRPLRDWLWRRWLRGADALQVPERAYGVQVVTPALIRTAHRFGVEVHVWTVNDPADMTRLLKLGVDGLVSDRADLAQHTVLECGSPQLGTS